MIKYNSGGKAERLFVLWNGGFAQGFCLGPSARAIPAHVSFYIFSLSIFPFSLFNFYFWFVYFFLSTFNLFKSDYISDDLNLALTCWHLCISENPLNFTTIFFSCFFCFQGRRHSRTLLTKVACSIYSLLIIEYLGKRYSVFFQSDFCLWSNINATFTTFSQYSLSHEMLKCLSILNIKTFIFAIQSA